jgi:hypothetical protein
MAPRHLVNGRRVRGPARTPDPQPAPTPEELKALIDRLDGVRQAKLLNLLQSDPESIIGQAFRNLSYLHQAGIASLGGAVGLDPEVVDPDELLTRVETDKEAKKRTKKSSVGAVRQARHKARKRQEKAMGRFREALSGRRPAQD